MKAHLLYRDRDLDLEKPLPWNADALTQDLALKTLFDAMARDDGFVFEVSKKVVLSSLENDVETIRYRQAILKDCLARPDLTRELYGLCEELMQEERRERFLGATAWAQPGWLLYESVRHLTLFVGFLRKLRNVADSHAQGFAADGWTGLFATLRRELTDDYLAEVENHLERLDFPRGVVLSAGLGEGNKGERYVLHEPRGRRHHGWRVLTEWVTRPFSERSDGYRFSVDPRDEAGNRILSELRDGGLADVANALAQSVDHVRSFFAMLRRELAFYVGCVNLHEQLDRKGEPSCCAVATTSEGRLSFRGLYDVCLSLSTAQRVVGNDADADGRDLVIITGANQGGKSTFLRSLGVAQLMMQAGLFAPAESFTASTRDGIFTHFKREEDVAMERGKLDEELSRMSRIVDGLTAHPIILFNESFAATNEREGSEIARQVVSALLERRVKIAYVTHQYEFAHGLCENDGGNVLFLRAEREAGGARTFKLTEGTPLRTSFAEDLYDSIFPRVRANRGDEEPFRGHRGS